jgi:hypothetical protein
MDSAGADNDNSGKFYDGGFHILILSDFYVIVLSIGRRGRPSL